MAGLKITTNAKFAIVDQLEIPLAEQTKLYIEGYASVNRQANGNKNVDRDNEVYDIPSLDIENFKSNGPILFGHDWDKVIGQVTHIEKTFEGLYIKAEIHKVPGLESVFYGIQNHLIKAFSISAIPKKFEYLEDEDAIELQDAELIEISVLAVPSNAQSLFNVTHAKSLRVNAKEVAKQNDITLCELKGICGLKPKEKGLEMEVKTKEPEVETQEAPTEAPSEAPSVEAPKAEAPSVEESKAEVPSKVEVPIDDIAAAVIAAQDKAEQIKQDKADQLAKEEAEKAQQAIDAEKARIDTAKSYIEEMTSAFVNTDNAELDPESIEDFYEMISNSIEKIETKITEAIVEQVKTA